MTKQYTYQLDEAQIPTRWYNIVADLPNPPATPCTPAPASPSAPKTWLRSSRWE